jgi:hypothetical protein
MTVIEVIDAHTPSLTVSNEFDIGLMIQQQALEADPDYADLAVRTCMCGKRIDGFYEYIDHLKEVLRDAGLVDDTGRRLT